MLGDTLIPEWVQRRLTGDTYNYINNSAENITHEHCDNTYLIDDDQCMMDQELFNGKVKYSTSMVYDHSYDYRMQKCSYSSSITTPPGCSSS